MNQTYETGRIPPVVAGPGSVARLGECMPGDSGHVLLVCDAGVAAAGLPARVEAALPGGFPVEQFVAPAGEPLVATVDEAAARARDLDGVTVIGLGGGTALDIAKLVAALVRNPGSVADYALGANPFSGRAPAVMIPTTAGTGAEVARTCVFSDADQRKLWAWSPSFSVDAIVLDPELTLSLPIAVSIPTGLDAFVHALEATTGRATNRWIEAAALAAIRLASTHLDTIVRAPDDVNARQAMQEAALLAGIAIDSGGTGIAHNIGHALGTVYHLPHGVAVTLGLQATLAWSIEAAPERFDAPAAAFVPGHRPEDLAAAFDKWVERLGFAAIAVKQLPHSLDARAIAEAMQAGENEPMARNSARPPEDDEWNLLAERVVGVCAHYRQAAVGVAS